MLSGNGYPTLSRPRFAEPLSWFHVSGFSSGPPTSLSPLPPAVLQVLTLNFPLSPGPGSAVRLPTFDPSPRYRPPQFSRPKSRFRDPKVQPWPLDPLRPCPRHGQALTASPAAGRLPAAAVAAAAVVWRAGKGQGPDTRPGWGLPPCARAAAPLGRSGTERS